MKKQMLPISRVRRWSNVAARISHGKLTTQPVHQQPLKSNTNDDDDIENSIKGFNEDVEEVDVEDVGEDVGG